MDSHTTSIRDAKQIFHAGVARVRADALWTEPIVERLRHQITSARKVIVVGTGKASMAMAGSLEAVLQSESSAERVDGLVVVPEGYPAHFPKEIPRPTMIRVVEGGHPVPNERGMAAARETLALVQGATAEDLVIALVSGGGSSLWAAFDESITLSMGQELFHALLRAGADIEAMNTVRQHLSLLGGGGCAEAAYPAPLEAFILSDVPGDDESVIASGPVSAPSSAPGAAIEVLQSFDLWATCAHPIRDVLQRLAQKNELETQSFAHVRTTLVGTNSDAQRAAATAAADLGYTVIHAAEEVTGEARQVARTLVDMVSAYQGPLPVCWIWGGETTVTVTGSGRGGRNQELALAAALSMPEQAPPMVVLSGGTDGIDGPTDAAGAWVTSQTLQRAHEQGLDPAAALANNDAYPLLDRLGQLLRTGPTHTNVMDLIVAIRTA